MISAVRYDARLDGTHFCAASPILITERSIFGMIISQGVMMCARTAQQTVEIVYAVMGNLLIEAAISPIEIKAIVAAVA